MTRARWLTTAAAIAVVAAGALNAPLSSANCSLTSVGLRPLTEGAGLYPSGQNTPPLPHTLAGVESARELAARRRVVLLSIGAGNADLEFAALRRLVHGGRGVPGDPEVHSRVSLVNGALGTCVLSCWSGRECPSGRDCWDGLERELRRARRSAPDVGAVWVKAVNSSWPNHDAQRWQETIVGDLRRTLQRIHERFPNVRQVFVSSGIYAAYGSSFQSREPFAYESGLAVRDLMSDAHRLPVWTAWGPYLWADGTTPNRDGLTWSCADYRPDGVHVSPAGQQKVAERLLAFFKTHAATRPWFLAAPAAPPL